jgi:hypothetical protein
MPFGPTCVRTSGEAWSEPYQRMGAEPGAFRAVKLAHGGLGYASHKGGEPHGTWESPLRKKLRQTTESVDKRTASARRTGASISHT